VAGERYRFLMDSRTGDEFSFYVFFELAPAAPCRLSRPSWPERRPASAPTGLLRFEAGLRW
jgi:hypothetical protein